MSSSRSYKYVLSSQYFLYFGVLGVFLPYFNLYCYHLDFSGFQIGALSAVRTVTTVLFPLLWGALADHRQIRRPIYIVCNAVSTGIWGLLLFTTDFWSMMAISFFYGVFYAPIISFLEAVTMDALGEERRQYGQVRMWGSINFVVVVIVVGRLVDVYSINLIVGLVFAGSLLQSLVAVRIADTPPVARPAFLSGAGALLRTRPLVFFVCAFIMLLSHGTYYGFFSIHLESVGYGKTFIGISWAVATISEILVMVKSDLILRRVSVEKILVLSFAAAVLRWLILALSTSPAVILGTQMMHALTYGAFHIASILYVDRLVPGHAKTFGQAANNAITYGLGITAGFILNGYFFEKIGAFNLFLMSAAIAASGGLIFGIYAYKNRTVDRS